MSDNSNSSKKRKKSIDATKEEEEDLHELFQYHEPSILPTIDIFENMEYFINEIFSGLSNIKTRLLILRESQANNNNVFKDLVITKKTNHIFKVCIDNLTKYTDDIIVGKTEVESYIFLRNTYDDIYKLAKKLLVVSGSYRWLASKRQKLIDAGEVKLAGHSLKPLINYLQEIFVKLSVIYRSIKFPRAKSHIKWEDTFFEKNLV
jgi:hypothetical protein